MNYSLNITKHAERDIQAAADYIEFNLYDQKASDDLLDEVEASITELCNYPLKYQLAEDAVLRNWGIRYFSVKNYLVFYVVEKNMIYVVRFLYQKRDWISILQREGIDKQ